MPTVRFIDVNRIGTDEITIDVLRALQGIGGAATIPAAVSQYSHNYLTIT